MGERDIVTKEYMADPVVFVDAFNYLLYDGRQVIDPGRLRQKDTAMLAVPYGKEGSAGAVQKYRDNLKSLTLMEDGNAEYLVLGIENQTDVNYAMPVRNMLYDAMQYAAQVAQRAREHRLSKDLFGGEFLSGFSKEDRLVPVITLVILFGTDRWDGPVRLHEMLAVQEEALLDFVPDYCINLMAPAAMRDEEINRLSSSLREVIMFIKYAADEEQMTELMKENDRFRCLDRQAANVINTLMNCRIEIDEAEEGVNMCLAWDKMRERARKDGERLGMEKGERQGMVKSIASLMASMGWTMEQAMDALQIPKGEQPSYAEKLKA